MWRYVGIEDALVVLRCVVVATIAAAAVILLAQPGPRLSIAVLILNSILLLLLVGGSRVALRLFGAWLHSLRGARAVSTRVLIYGAGARGDLLVRQILSHGKYVPVGFIDDDRSKTGRRLHGISIYNPSDFRKVTCKHVISEVLVSSAKIPEEKALALGIAVRWI